MESNPRQKLYCYVDESGQDDASNFFAVVAAVTESDHDGLRQALLDVEQASGTGCRKWHKSRPERRLRYLDLVLERGISCLDVFFGLYAKPLPYFFPFVEVLDHAIRAKATGAYTARVFVDGIDQQKAGELTSALRGRGICLEMVRSRRDESEPLIRLADMWAGCIRASTLGGGAENELLRRAMGQRKLVKLP
jgi:hypothetical protein